MNRAVKPARDPSSPSSDQPVDAEPIYITRVHANHDGSTTFTLRTSNFVVFETTLPYDEVLRLYRYLEALVLA